MKHFEDRLAVERKADAKIAFVIMEILLVPAGKSGQCFIDAWELLDATFSVLNFRQLVRITDPCLWSAEDHAPELCRRTAENRAPEL